ncbi:MAG: AAA family ATPase [Blastochloris sp.]|nr:AAA family ATPase [Blastochloris sp.]
MLIEFSVGNYRSFNERVTLSMEAADIASQPASLDEQNVFAATDDLRLLTSAAIYGANASGKSNLIAALRMMRSLILSSSRETQVGEPIAAEPFLLSTETEDQPSEFEMVFIDAGTQYRYGFAVTEERVMREWLYRMSSRMILPACKALLCRTTLFTHAVSQDRLSLWITRRCCRCRRYFSEALLRSYVTVRSRYTFAQ